MRNSNLNMARHVFARSRTALGVWQSALDGFNAIRQAMATQPELFYIRFGGDPDWIMAPFAVELEGFYIKPNYQGRGIGRKLLQRALSEAGDAGYESVILTTNKNLTSAIKMYESFGWVRQPGKPDNGADYLYALNLMKGYVQPGINSP